MKKITIIVKSNNRDTISEMISSVSYGVNHKDFNNSYIDEQDFPIEMYKSKYGGKIEDYEPHNPYVDVSDEEGKKEGEQKGK